MNREIKFRFVKKHKVTGKIILIPYSIYELGESHQSNANEGDEYVTIARLQYTGLKDRNGVEIYEGDIVKCSSGCPHVVEWMDEVPSSAILGGGMPGFYFSGLKEGYAFLGTEEVIGNLYENAELLKDKE